MVPIPTLPAKELSLDPEMVNTPAVEVMFPEPEYVVPPEMAPDRLRDEMLDRAPEEFNLRVPAPDPVFIPVVAFRVVPVMVFEVEIVPNPEAMDPVDKAPTVVMSVPINLEAAMDPANMALVTFDVPIAVTPALDIVTSPVIATEVGTLDPFPTRMLADEREANLEKSIAEEALISALTITPDPMAVVNDPVPDPVTSPVRVMVWSPVLVPERLAAVMIPVTLRAPVIFVSPLTFSLYTPGLVVPMPTLYEELSG